MAPLSDGYFGSRRLGRREIQKERKELGREEKNREEKYPTSDGRGPDLVRPDLSEQRVQVLQHPRPSLIQLLLHCRTEIAEKISITPSVS